MTPSKQVSGRFIAGTISGFIGFISTFYFFGTKYQLVKYTPPELNEDGTVKAKKFRLRFSDPEPLQLKADVAARQEKLQKEYEERERLKDIIEREQIAQEPTS